MSKYIRISISTSIFLLWLHFFAFELIYGNWEGILVCFSALVLIPEAVNLIFTSEKMNYLFSIAGLLLLPAYSCINFSYSYLLCLPYIILILQVSITYSTFLTKEKNIQKVINWMPLLALSYLLIGAIWIFCFLKGLRPFDFSPTIVGLTAAHFHIAGFVFTIHVWQLLKYPSVRFKKILSWGAFGGMPVVALGILLSQLGISERLESIASLGFILFVLFVIFEQIRLSKHLPLLQNILLKLSGYALLTGMIFATFYAVRFFYPISFFSIPNMKIWHGTLNVLGFALPIIIAWSLNTSNISN